MRCRFQLGLPATIAVALAGLTARPASADPPARVYVVNGLDPFGWAKAERLADQIRTAGYTDTRFGSAFRARRIERDLRAAYAADPNTPIALIGFSMGTYQVRRIAERLGRDGIPVAVVGYVGGDFLPGSSAAWPTNVGRVVNITGNGYLLTGRNLIANGAEIPGAVNLRLPVRHFALPGRPETADMILQELAASDLPPRSAAPSSSTLAAGQ